MRNLIFQPEVLGALVLVLIGFPHVTLADETELTSQVQLSCMDSHGGVYIYKGSMCPDVNAYNSTPEYQYTDRETQRLQMILNRLSAQGEANIAAAGASHDISVTTLSNDQAQRQSASQSQGQGQIARNNASSNSSSSATNSNTIDNTNNNSNTSVNANANFNGVFK